MLMRLHGSGALVRLVNAMRIDGHSHSTRQTEGDHSEYEEAPLSEHTFLWITHVWPLFLNPTRRSLSAAVRAYDMLLSPRAIIRTKHRSKDGSRAQCQSDGRPR